MPLTLTAFERHLLAGGDCEARALAMRILVAAAEMLGANELVEIASAHVDGCLYHGDGGVEFAERLVAGGGKVAVSTTLNVGALDLLHPERVRSGSHARFMARRQMEAYRSLGCTPTWTCAPYQAGHRPAFGEQVAWGESNAIAFCNSVLGARTERYGDFLDACCAVTARAPLYGLHTSEARRATVVIDASRVPPDLAARDVFYAVLGTWLGRALGEGEIGVIGGLDAHPTEDQLKALGAAAASSGAVALFHVAGVTPEAPTVEDALGHQPAGRRLVLTGLDLSAAADRLTTAVPGSGASLVLDAVAVGSPHFSVQEFDRLVSLLDGIRFRVPFYACTGRGVLEQLERTGQREALERAGVVLIVDTCVVVTPILPVGGGVLMTCSGKFAHYGPATTGFETVFGSLEDCVRSAAEGRVVRAEGVWSW